MAEKGIKIVKRIAGFFILVLAIGFVVLGILMLLPLGASKPCLLGYYAHCSFAPISSIILFGISLVVFLLGFRFFKSS